MRLAWERRDVCKVFVLKPEGKKPLGRQRCWWEDGITVDLREIGWEGVEWVQLARERSQ
jgi:hypothetical protein